MQVCFIGHRSVQNKEELLSSLKETVIDLIGKGATTFLFGSMSEFNDLSLKTVTSLKAEYPFIRRVYVRSDFQYIDTSYEKYLLEHYEETYFPPKLENAGKYSYVERNYEMIDSSDYCVFYYNESYTPESSKRFKHNKLLPRNSKSGTKIAYNYAIKRGKIIFNLHK